MYAQFHQNFNFTQFFVQSVRDRTEKILENIFNIECNNETSFQ